MKTLTQVVLPIVIVIGLIGGVTFVAQYSGTRPRDKVTGPILPSNLGDDPLLVFPVSDGTWELTNDPDKTPYVGEFEVRNPGHYDFWFRNTTPAPVDLKLAYTSCRCTKLQVGSPPGTRQLASAAACELAAGTVPWPCAPALLATDLGVRALIEQDMTWQELPEVGATISVPAAGADSPGIGLLRLGFEAKGVPEPVRLKVDLLASQAGKIEKTVLTLPAVFVPALRPDFPSGDARLEFGELSASEPKQTVVFNCWSSTRDHFDLTVAEAKGNPCFECTAQPLTEDERRDLAAKLSAVKGTLLTRVRSAYRVTVTVHERRQGSVLDLGPFQRRVLIQGPEEYTVLVNGTVKGEIAVRSADSKGAINLGPFKAARGTMKPVTLESENAGVELKLLKSETRPDYLEVTLDKEEKVDGVKRWRLTVTVPPGKASGLLPPEDSAVILQTHGETGRRMRIPVTGEATQ